MTFDKSEYEAQTFEDLDLRAEVLEDITFLDCIFEACQLTEASLKRSTFSGCTFRNCDLSMANVTDAEFTETLFEATLAVGVNWALSSESAYLGTDLNFEDCTLKYGVFMGLDLSKRRFVNCNLQEADFSGAKLVETDLKGSDLAGSLFRNCDLTKANFVGAKNYRINVRENKLKGAKFSIPEALGLLSGLEIELS